MSRTETMSPHAYRRAGSPGAAPSTSQGAELLGRDRCRFRVWAPAARRVELRVVAPERRTVALEPQERGYHEAVVEGVGPGARYFYGLDGGEDRPDPVSRYQPEGVHGPSEIVDPAFDWTAPHWTGLRLEDYVIYELHIGTFTAEGTFDAASDRLDHLVRLGVTAVELMPVAQFPGSRNWGYDGVNLCAVQDSYGGPAGLKRFVDACHRRGLAVVLDVVYNHLGPEGNYLAEFGPYFTERYRTPWGRAINFDGRGSDEVRRFFIDNALFWVTEYRIDALRLDAVHAIFDFSATHILEEMAVAVSRRADALGRRIHLIAESDLNDPRLIRSREVGGYGLDAQWADDFHHAVHALLTGEREGYYIGFGRVEDLARALREGYTYTGQYSAYRNRRHGRSPAGLPGSRFVVCIQNHDQVGNRMLGERLSELVSFPAHKLAAGILLLSPFVPLLFMGEEYGEAARFPYFVSHGDPELVEAVRRGRAGEFEAFRWKGDPPDPQAEETFASARLEHGLRESGRHGALLRLYRELLRLRREVPALAHLSTRALEAVPFEEPRALFMLRRAEGSQAAALFHFDDAPARLTLPLPPRRWRRVLDSRDAEWDGPGSSGPAAVDSRGAPILDIEPLGFTLWLREA